MGVTDIENEGVFKYGNDESPLSWDNWNTLVMGQGSSPARPWLGALGFWRALGPTLGEGLKPGPGPGPWSKARGLKGLLEYDFPLKNWHYFGKILSKNLKSQMQIISFAIFSLFLVSLFLFEVFWSYA